MEKPTFQRKVLVPCGWASLIGLLPGFLLMLGSQNLTDYPFSPALWLIIGPLFFAVPTFLVQSVRLGIASSEYQERQRNEWNTRKLAEAAADRAAEDAAKHRAKRLAAEVDERSERAVELFESLPKWLDNSASWVADARKHFAAGAFSPFWSSIENAYAALGAYNGNVRAIENLATRYRADVTELHRLESRVFPAAFPIDLDDVRATAAAEEAARQLGGVVYEAQRHPVFAQIWEQRRTTAAVSAGFANLEDAVNRMSLSLQSSVAGLSLVIQSELSESRSASGAAASAADRLASAQLTNQIALNKRVDDAVWLLEQAERRAV
ncbi:hypothetical protein [Microbacterium rhizosphaerae]|uniref:Chemotaxis protein n=1 Tax=Microbacterium rhizosphaerae TaxID=1678237 RepID=A0ABZ0SST9_9MICO|nr:hypothetical protein [Microbacterium rhizosphaerae]WPR91324.1 hypothetical protein SM116_08625 [Microbacterium rhizosphaerae]